MKRKKFDIQDYLDEGKMPTKRKMIKHINTLEMENETLRETIKDELYKRFMDKLGEPLEMGRIKNENKRLRRQIKTLKELLKEAK